MLVDLFDIDRFRKIDWHCGSSFVVVPKYSRSSQELPAFTLTSSVKKHHFTDKKKLANEEKVIFMLGKRGLWSPVTAMHDPYRDGFLWSQVR